MLWADEFEDFVLSANAAARPGDRGRMAAAVARRWSWILIVGIALPGVVTGLIASWSEEGNSATHDRSFEGEGLRWNGSVPARGVSPVVEDIGMPLPHAPERAAALTLDEIVAVAEIVEHVTRRPLSPSESARLKSAWGGCRGLVEIAEKFVA